VLFDEIEKAHPDVFNMLLQILDDGRLTDNKGRTVDFKNTVVIMTSNVGAEFIPDAKEMERDYDVVEKTLTNRLRQTFRPEFLNRVDEIIVFHALSREELRQIVDLLLAHLRRQVEGQGMHLEVTDAAREVILSEGYDPTFGARPLKRAIQRLVENPLSRELLRGTFAEGDTIRADAENGAIGFGRA
jgi:ATP-dependent Clp protease ATP-binding subunit ClpC